MQLVISAVGKAGTSPEAALAERYLKRIRCPVKLTEVDIRGKLSPRERQRREADKLLAAIPGGACKIALDEKGKSYSSTEFAKWIDQRRSQGVNCFAFIIGGADGLDDSITGSADIILSLGAMTWPHLLARSMLMEQLYRALTILDGHPYHRN